MLLYCRINSSLIYLKTQRRKHGQTDRQMTPPAKYNSHAPSYCHTAACNV
ncbi:UNVERIFIED_CONTAM: hypothetical protein FKN15_071313 [Acipenser sinensis]